MSPIERAVIELIARWRENEAQMGGYRGRFGGAEVGTKASLASHRIGVTGELLTAKELDVYPNFQSYREDRDNGGYDFPRYRIGCRAAAKRFGLLCRDTDPDDGRWVASVIVDGGIEILGWEYVAAARDPQWLRNPHDREPAHFKPERLLRPIGELVGIVNVERVYVT